MSGEVVADWQAGGPVASLAYDPDQARLLVGMSDSGTVITYELAAFLSVRGERGPPAAGLTIETGLAAVSEIDVPPDQPALLFRGPDGSWRPRRPPAWSWPAVSWWPAGSATCRGPPATRPAARSWWPPTSTATCWW